jgi:hypothetical protein
MLNNKQRSRWLSDFVSELQRFASKSQGCPEMPLVTQALARLDDARRKVREAADEEKDECP